MILEINKNLELILKDTSVFFEDIFVSEELQIEYDLKDYIHRDYVFNVIKEFKKNPNTFIVKPFYENDYKDASVPRSITIKRNSQGFLMATITNENIEPYIIEPFRFVSIIKESIEDENIKREMNNEHEEDTEMDR